MHLSPEDTHSLMQELARLESDTCVHGHAIGTRQIVCKVVQDVHDYPYASVTLICEVCLVMVAEITSAGYPYLDDADDLIIVLKDGVWRRT